MRRKKSWAKNYGMLTPKACLGFNTSFPAPESLLAFEGWTEKQGYFMDQQIQCTEIGYRWIIYNVNKFICSFNIHSQTNSTDHPITRCT